jgi:hypothetical protein
VSRRQIGVVVALVGVVAALIAALADPLGISGAENEFGWKQILLLAVGILLIISGGVLALRSPSSGTTPPPR